MGEAHSRRSADDNGLAAFSDGRVDRHGDGVQCAASSHTMRNNSALHGDGVDISAVVGMGRNETTTYHGVVCCRLATATAVGCDIVGICTPVHAPPQTQARTVWRRRCDLVIHSGLVFCLILEANCPTSISCKAAPALRFTTSCSCRSPAFIVCLFAFGCRISQTQLTFPPAEEYLRFAGHDRATEGSVG